MKWYYAKDAQQQGPVDEAELARLVASGTIQGSTLVWCEGMPDWLPYQSAWKPGMADWRAATSPSSASSASTQNSGPVSSEPSSGASTLQACAICGLRFSPSTLERIHEQWVCPTCKPSALRSPPPSSSTASASASSGGRPGSSGAGYFAASSPAAVKAETLLEWTKERPRTISASACLQRSWELFRNDIGLTLGAVLVTYLCMMAAGMVPFLGMCLGIFVNGPLMAGLWLVFIRAYRRQATSVGDVFQGFSSSWLPLVGGNLLIQILSVVVFAPLIAYASMVGFSLMQHPGRGVDTIQIAIFCVLLIAEIPIGIYAVGSLLFTLPLIIDRRLPVMDAIMVSWRVANRNLGFLFLLGVLSLVLGFLGTLACVIGLLVTMPLVSGMWAAAYEDLLGPRVEPPPVAADAAAPTTQN